MKAGAPAELVLGLKGVANSLQLTWNWSVLALDVSLVASKVDV